jgi:hypothetical protein
MPQDWTLETALNEILKCHRTPMLALLTSGSRAGLFLKRSSRQSLRRGRGDHPRPRTAGDTEPSYLTAHTRK